MRGGHGPFGTLPDLYKSPEKSGDTEAAVQDRGLRSYERDLFQQEDRGCLPAEHKLHVPARRQAGPGQCYDRPFHIPSPRPVLKRTHGRIHLAPAQERPHLL